MNYLRRVIPLNRKKPDPNKFIFTGIQSEEPIDIQLFKYNKDSCIEKTEIQVSEIENFESKDYCQWLNIYGISDPDIVATIFIPLTFIAGIYGMNFQYMPELEWEYGYIAVWAVILVVLASMVIFFKKKKWF
jgi:hypothetical protein